MILYWLNLAMTFGVFSAICMRLYETRRPDGRTFAGILSWLGWLFVHLGIAIPMLIIMGTQWSDGAGAPLHIVVLKGSLAVLLLAPWRRRESDL